MFDSTIFTRRRDLFGAGETQYFGADQSAGGIAVDGCFYENL